jgi:hypothetical protein
MPNKDKTGPEGKGPMTGRGLGKCNPNNTNSVKGKELSKDKGLGLRKKATQ